MPEFAAVIQDYASTATTLEVALAAIGVLALATALIGWVARIVSRNRKPGRRPRRASAYGGDDYAGGDAWSMENGIVFPAGGANDFRHERLQFDDGDDKLGSVTEMVAGGLDEIAGTGERVLDAVRKRPVEFIAGALAAGFAAGLVLPLFSTRNRTEKLLEKLILDRAEANREAEREADRFRQARQK